MACRDPVMDLQEEHQLGAEEKSPVVRGCGCSTGIEGQGYEEQPTETGMAPGEVSDG